MRDLDLKPSFHLQVAYKASWDEIGGDAPQFAETRRPTPGCASGVTGRRERTTLRSERRVMGAANRMSTPRRVSLPFVAAVVAAMALAGSVSSKVPPSGFPASMPSTPMPSIRDCSSSQRAFLEKAWRVAHFTTWRAKRVVEFVLAQPPEERAALWSRDYVVGDNFSPSPRRWFGNSTTSEASYIREALQKAEARFRMKGDNVKGVKNFGAASPAHWTPRTWTSVLPAIRVATGPRPRTTSRSEPSSPARASGTW